MGDTLANSSVRDLAHYERGRCWFIEKSDGTIAMGRTLLVVVRVFSGLTFRQTEALAAVDRVNLSS